MILVLFGVAIYAFLLLGSIVFVICALAGPLRKYALSAALWCAIWGPCCDAFATLAGLSLVAEGYVRNGGNWPAFQKPHLMGAFGWAYLGASLLVTAAVASAVSWFHQKLVRRFTFALFRLYATAVVGGIGGVFGCALGLWLLTKEDTYWGFLPGGAGVLVLIVLFAFLAYRNAGLLRGEAPTSFTWIAPDEFAGTDGS